MNSLKGSFSSAGRISAISIRVSPFVWRNSVIKATPRFVFFTVFWFSCSSINVSMEHSKEANHVGFKSRSETRGPRLCTGEFSSFFVCDWANDVFSLVKIHRSRFLLANGFNALVLRGLFFVCKSQYLWNNMGYPRIFGAEDVKAAHFKKIIRV